MLFGFPCFNETHCENEDSGDSYGADAMSLHLGMEKTDSTKSVWKMVRFIMHHSGERPQIAQLGAVSTQISYSPLKITTANATASLQLGIN